MRFFKILFILVPAFISQFAFAETFQDIARYLDILDQRIEAPWDSYRTWVNFSNALETAKVGLCYRAYQKEWLYKSSIIRHCARFAGGGREASERLGKGYMPRGPLDYRIPMPLDAALATLNGDQPLAPLNTDQQNMPESEAIRNILLQVQEDLRNPNAKLPRMSKARRANDFLRAMEDRAGYIMDGCGSKGFTPLTPVLGASGLALLIAAGIPRIVTEGAIGARDATRRIHARMTDPDPNNNLPIAEEIRFDRDQNVEAPVAEAIDRDHNIEAPVAQSATR